MLTVNESGETTRQLVSLRNVGKVVKHPNADALDLIMVDGWQCIAKIGEFKEGDRCVYVEIDTILPDGNPAWQFLVDKQGKNFPSGRGARLKTVKLRGEFSQGLALPLTAFSNQDIDFTKPLDEQFNVRKYEPEQDGGALSNQARGSYPYWMPKTDQERVENCFREMFMLQEVQDLYWIIEEKLEGSSVTVYSDEGNFGITGRNIDFKLDVVDNKYVNTAMKLGLDKIVEIPGKWGLRGELLGPGVQGNIYKLDNFLIYIYDVWDGDNQRYLTPVERMDFLDKMKALGASIYEVPAFYPGIKLPDNVEDVIKMADGTSKLHNTKREGIVFKCESSCLDRFGKPVVVSFKAVSREYLLNEK